MQAILNALSFMPIHRKESSRRAQMIGLDDLIDEAREMKEIDGNTLDLIFMGYRLHAPASKHIDNFLNKKSLKPKALHDLLVLCFSALITRDRTPHAIIVNNFVEAASKRFGNHTKGLVNAFARGLLRSEISLPELTKKPNEILPPTLCKRWEENPQLLETFAKIIGTRPESGIAAFGADLVLKRKSLDEWQAEKPFQAIDEGSWALCNWILDELQKSETPVNNFLDVCAAPGGKFIALATQLQNLGLKMAYATEGKYPRLKRLEENILSWKPNVLNKAETKIQRLTWGEDKITPEIAEQEWDLVLLDLPCSGSGTLHTRPDLLLENWWERIKELQIIQKSIIEAAQNLKHKHIFVSICSVDPEEIQYVSKIMGKNPSWSSFTDYASANSIEGLTAWH